MRMFPQPAIIWHVYPSKLTCFATVLCQRVLPKLGLPEVGEIVTQVVVLLAVDITHLLVQAFSALSQRLQALVEATCKQQT